MQPVQITHAEAPEWRAPEYPTINLRNCDGTYAVLVAVDHFDLYRVLPDGSLVLVKRLPIAAREEPRWSLTDPEVLYYHVGRGFRSLNVNSMAVVDIHAFTEYDSIDGLGESDICEDGATFVFSGVKPGADQEVFTYSLKDGQGPAFAAPPELSSLYVTPSFVICGTLNGVFLFSHSGKPFGQIIAGEAPHMDVIPDRESMVYCSSNDPTVGKNAVVWMDLHNPQTSKRVLLDLPQGNWSAAFHISAGKDRCIVSTYSFIDPMLVPELWDVPYNQNVALARVICQIPTIIHGDADRKYLGEPKAVLSENRYKARVYMSVDSGPGGTVNTWMVKPDNKPDTVAVPVVHPDHAEFWDARGALPFDETTDIVCFNSTAKNVSVYRRK